MNSRTPMLIVVVEIDDDFLAEIDSGAALGGWSRDSVAAWGAVIAGESVADGKREGPVHLGQDGGAESRHVGWWRAY